MEPKLEKKYGLFTAIAMVVGIVIGSGVFFKAEKILTATGGNLKEGILAWVIGGIIMISCAYTFSVMATKYQYINGVVDYAEAAMGKTYAYYVGWFMAVIYYPTITSVLAWVSARYTCVIFGFSITGGECMTIACLYLVTSFTINALSPVLAGKFQVSTTVIKLIPLFLMAVVGTFAGLRSGMTLYNFTHYVSQSSSNGLFTAIVAASFAYEGWIIATCINAELRNAKKNLPLALIVGTFITMSVYILYYIGLAGTIKNEVMMAGGESGAKLAFQTVFTSAGGSLLFVFVIISCLGTLNGLMLGCTRGIYSIAARGLGPKPQVFSQIDPATNMPVNSAIMGLFLCAIWLFYFYGANLTSNWFGFFSFDSSELPIITIYALYIPIFIMFMVKGKELNFFNRIFMPCVSLAGCIFMVTAAWFAHGMAAVAYLIVFFVIMTSGAVLLRRGLPLR
ncbi:MAG: APC family permease [Lacrimispora celerecrescens]|uniref:APC family permease n=1 Tax=Lacrimispora indolis TaxID=69825 RepID=UPI0004042D3B|nr:APC family permease [[Clostridium] methoxybenzovorans]MBE7719220.1 APC family permease [Lacrimispora celerecrescens]